MLLLHVLRPSVISFSPVTYVILNDRKWGLQVVCCISAHEVTTMLAMMVSFICSGKLYLSLYDDVYM